MIVYVLCPHMVLSGGPELLHQFVFYLNSSGIKAYITYYGYKPDRGGGYRLNILIILMISQCSPILMIQKKILL